MRCNIPLLELYDFQDRITYIFKSRELTSQLTQVYSIENDTFKRSSLNITVHLFLSDK